jgi:hypothetical protein
LAIPVFFSVNETHFFALRLQIYPKIFCLIKTLILKSNTKNLNMAIINFTFIIAITICIYALFNTRLIINKADMAILILPITVKWLHLV